VDVEHFISEMTYKSTALRFLVRVWCLSRLCGYSGLDLDDPPDSPRDSIVVSDRGVQNRTNSIEKPQTEPTQTETAKNRIWFGCNQIVFLLNHMVWFGLRFSFYQPNQTEPNCNIRKILIKHM